VGVIVEVIVEASERVGASEAMIGLRRCTMLSAVTVAIVAKYHSVQQETSPSTARTASRSARVAAANATVIPAQHELRDHSPRL